MNSEINPNDTTSVLDSDCANHSQRVAQPDSPWYIRMLIRSMAECYPCGEPISKWAPNEL